ncbi:aspartate 4-decarboxylase [Clostridium sp. NSJ-6]|uniref:Aminotransferase n=1 Tax=Clostridium hominis TaxID=2763036 RepID=A0ABR7DDU8_9CLOT|nr:aspartate 4-decarboxylase [Clostridium hominis]MBC5629013.1 aspartate 4-decarboxylase [Clostridium hominis]MDU2671927.1 aspartate 4-decarboxylase [Clostridium sp.]
MDTILTKEQLSRIYGRISPFEFKDKLISIAQKNGTKILDAGRGNPNWTAATPREAFFTFGQFAVLETQRTWSKGDLAGMVQKEGIADRFKEFLNSNTSTPGINLLKDILDYGINTLDFNQDDFIYELTDGIIGDNYPFPDRMLVHIEKIVHDYLLRELCQDKKFENEFDVFAVEGGTAAMCYVFDSLVANSLLNPGDKIALMTPIFTPYLEIPHLPNYNFEVINIHANEVDDEGYSTFQFPKSELDKLKDTDIKVLFVVNPNNPASIALSNECKENLIDIVKNHNPNLMIITDDVYCTFVDDFSSIISDLPYNTLAVYSLSKYFGVTGWRLGTIMLSQDNIYNKLISELPVETKARLNERYMHLSLKPENISFIDRVVADSRQVALNHTAGLSTPQQVQMAFFCAFALIDTNNNYKSLTKEICKNRKKLLFDGLELELRNQPHDAAYYTELNLLDLAREKYDNGFAEYLEANYRPLDIIYTLANNFSIILLNGDGFASSEWSLRVSLANLNDDSYYIIGSSINQMLDNLSTKYNLTKSIKLSI